MRSVLKYAVFMVFLCTVIILCSCDGTSPNSTIFAKSFLGNPISLNVSVKNFVDDGSDEHTYFKDKISFQKLLDKIKSSTINHYKNLVVTNYQDECILIEEYNDDELIAYYALVRGRLSTDDKNNEFYLFSGMGAPFGYSRDRYSEEITILFPLHLLEHPSEISLLSANYVNILEHPYETKFCENDFYNFYHKTNRFTLVDTETGFILKDFSQNINEQDSYLQLLSHGVEFIFASEKDKDYVEIRLWEVIE